MVKGKSAYYKRKNLERVIHKWRCYSTSGDATLFITCALTFLFGMASTSEDATPPFPKTARLMAEMIKLGDQIRRMSYENEEGWRE